MKRRCLARIGGRARAWTRARPIILEGTVPKGGLIFIACVSVTMAELGGFPVPRGSEIQHCAYCGCDVYVSPSNARIMMQRNTPAACELCSTSNLLALLNRA